MARTGFENLRSIIYQKVKHWLRRAYKRKLLAETNVVKFQELIDELTPKLSVFINSLGRKPTND